MRRSPILTLVYGLVFAVGLLIASSVAVSKRVPAAARAVPSTPPASSPAPAPSPPPLAKVNAAWAGEVDGGGALLAISVKDGVAVAYLCDGERTEVWLVGTAENGKLSLVSKKGTTLTGTFGQGTATGKISNSGRSWSFTIATAAPPSGLYRATQNVRTAQVVCGWVRLANGRTVGICSSDGDRPEAAPPLDTTRTQPVDPVAVTA